MPFSVVQYMQGPAGVARLTLRRERLPKHDLQHPTPDSSKLAPEKIARQEHQKRRLSSLFERALNFESFQSIDDSKAPTMAPFEHGTSVVPKEYSDKQERI